MSKLIIFSDGASKGNPGDAGIGVIVTSEDGVTVSEISEYIGKTTNNVAEYKALIRGLKECADLGATSVEISTDSELMARQITGVYRVKSENLKPLYAEVMKYIRAFKSVSISHVMREFNKRADQLANDGVKKKYQRPGARVQPEPVILKKDTPIKDVRLVQGELEL